MTQEVLFKEFRFYFDKDSFISYFSKPGAPAQEFYSLCNKAFQKQTLLEVPEESLTKQPVRYIQTNHVKFFTMIDVYPAEEQKPYERIDTNNGQTNEAADTGHAERDDSEVQHEE